MSLILVTFSETRQPLMLQTPTDVSVTKTVGFKNQMASSLHNVSYQEIHRRSLPCQLSSFDFQKSSEKQKYDLTIVPIVMVKYFSVGVR
jgi:hypothetical protein